MQVYPVLLLSFIYRLPETPRWFIFHERNEDAKDALTDIYGEKDMHQKYDELVKAHEEESAHSIGYNDMIWPYSEQYHQTMVTIMGQVNQALTGYGAISVYGPQIFELLGIGVMMAEYLTQANYVSYFVLMTFAWLLIDRLGRRLLMVVGAFGISACFVLLTVLGGLAMNSEKLGIPQKPVGIVGSVVLFIATGAFGIGWLTQPWLIPTEIYPSTSRAQGAAISVVIWGLANFAVTLLTPILFNNLNYWFFLVLAVTNLFAAWWTFVSLSLSQCSTILPLTPLDRSIVQRQGEEPLKRIKSFSRMPKSRSLGLCSRSTTATTGTCLRARRVEMRMVRVSHCLAAHDTHR